MRPFLGALTLLTFLQILALPAALLLSPLYALVVLARGRGPWVRHVARRAWPISPQALYRLLDPADPQNRWARRGCLIVPAGAGGRFRLSDPRLPDETLILAVTQAAPGQAIAYSAQVDPPPPGAALVSTASRYDLAPDGAGGVRLVQQEFLAFRPGVSPLGAAFHELLARFSIAIDLARLAHAARAATTDVQQTAARAA